MNGIKQVMIDAVMGKAFLSEADARKMEAKGFVTFYGSVPWQARWQWNKEALGKLSTEQLVELWMREV